MDCYRQCCGGDTRLPDSFDNTLDLNIHKGSDVTENTPYNIQVVRWFAVMTVVWGIVGMAVGVLIAGQLAWPALNFDIPWLSLMAGCDPCIRTR